MADSYHELEPWYQHLYAVLHEALRGALASPGTPAGRAPDAGCGTGFQTAVLADLGYGVHGVDVSTRALRVAREQLARSGLGPRVWLAAADLVALPYGAASFDAAVCCGSTLNFVRDPARAVAEIGRVLRP